MLIGSRLFIESLMVYLLVMVFYLITKVLGEVKLLLQEKSQVSYKKNWALNTLFGNLNAKRDWGHAKDYTEMQWRILQKTQ